MPRTGRPPAHDPKSNRITVRLSTELFIKFEEYCKEKGLSMAEALRLAVEKMLGEKK